MSTTTKGGSIRLILTLAYYASQEPRQTNIGEKLTYTSFSCADPQGKCCSTMIQLPGSGLHLRPTRPAGNWSSVHGRPGDLTAYYGGRTTLD